MAIPNHQSSAGPITLIDERSILGFGIAGGVLLLVGDEELSFEGERTARFWAMAPATARPVLQRRILHTAMRLKRLGLQELAERGGFEPPVQVLARTTV